ncbi:MAG: sigma-70 family RNA polymerase sigma factor [Phycisphaerae bacterium]|nr:sigma-70 family RNA polymerase sigma factor [Phycisphaerae bacterium]
MSDDSESVRGLLADIRAGGARTIEQLSVSAYDRLRNMAEQHLRRWFGPTAPSLTWQPTELVNETLLRIIKQRHRFDSDGHFFAIFTTMMKRVLLDYVRERQTLKRGGGGLRIAFDPELHSPATRVEDEGLDVEALFAAVDRLAELDGRKAEVAWMRLIWGMTLEEVAAALAVSRATIERDWGFARAWLRAELDSARA